MRIGLRNRGVAATSVAGVALRASQLLATLVTIPLLVGHLGVAGFGVWGAATSLVWLVNMLDLGIGSGLVVTLPRAISGGRTGEARDLVGAALFVGVGAATVLLAAGAIFLTATKQFEASSPFAVAAAALALNVPLSVSGRAWLSIHKGYVANLWEFGQTFLALALTVWGALGNADVALLVAVVYGALLAANTGSLVHFLVANPELRPTLRVSGAAIEQVATKGVLLFAATAASVASYAFDNVLTLAWLGPVASGKMTIALRICTTAAGFLGVISQAFWPAFVDAMARGERAWMRRALTNAFWLLFGLSVLGAAVLVVFGRPALKVWLHRDIEFGPTIFWLMAGWIVLMSLPLVPGLITASGRHVRGLLAINAAAAAAALLAKAPMANTWGLTGILASTPISALLVAFPVTLWLAFRSIADLPKSAASTAASKLGCR